MIWCVEDDVAIRDVELYALQFTGFEARGFEDGTSFWAALQTEKPDLVVLDVMLPGLDGVELIKKIRANSRLADLPIIMATAKGAEYDKIQSLDLGADDYVVKPFSVMELISRIKAVMRRYKAPDEQKMLKFGGLMVNLDEHIVTVDGKRVQLTYKEYELLRLFLSPPAQLLRGNSYLPPFGVRIMWAKHGHWICTYVPCGKSWGITASTLKLCVV